MSQVVIFVHGLGGSAKKSWGKFPQLIDSDTDLNKIVTHHFYSFPTFIIRIPRFLPYPSIQGIALALKTEIDTRFKSTEKIILVGHSLGTLVIRRYLIDSVLNGDKSKVLKVLLYAAPNQGSNWAELAKAVSWTHQQLEQLCKNSDFLEHLNYLWFDLNIAFHFDVRCVLAGVDKCVSLESSKSICKHLDFDVIANKGHTNVIKPTDENDLSFLILKKFILQPIASGLQQDLTQKLNQKIQKQKNNKKYIPDVFIELNSIKEKLRFVADPLLFFKKIIKEINSIDFTYFNSFFSKIGVSPVEINVEGDLIKDLTLDNVCNKSKEITQILADKKIQLPDLKADHFKSDLSEEEYKYLIKNDFSTWRIGYFIDDFQEKLSLFEKRCVLLTEKAGQGKTNLICDFAENFILRKEFLGVLLSGNEFNNIRRDSIEKVILREIVGFKEVLTFDECINKIGDICSQKKCTFSIIIDGLNENTDIELFSQELYAFIERILKYKFVRVILTCRSEYVHERFSRLFENPSFQDEFLLIDDFMKSYRRDNVKDHLRDRIIEPYFRYFQVKSQVFDHVRRKLSRDFLLLRIFCEVYGHRHNPNASNAQVYDIFKDDLFKAYFDYKYESLGEIASGYSKTDFQTIFSEILRYMVKNGKYINIPIEKLTSIQKPLLDYIVSEDIFFRKDLIVDEQSALGNKEVINFTFDEFRDYLLTDHLLIEAYDVEDFLVGLSGQYHSILEGVLKYLFLKSRRELYREKLHFLESCDKLFLGNIFSVNEDLIIEKDILRIKKLFLNDIDTAAHITSFLIYRFRTEHYKKLNIRLLIDLIITLNDHQYSTLINPIFKANISGYHNHYYDTNSHFTYDIVELAKDLTPILKETDFNKEPSWHSFMEFFILISGVRSREYGGVSYEVKDFIKKYISKFQEVGKGLLLKYRDIGLSQVHKNIWELLAFCAEEEIEFSEEFCQEVYHHYDTIKDNKAQQKVMLTILDGMYRKQPSIFNEEQRSFLENIKKKHEDVFAKFLMSMKQ